MAFQGFTRQPNGLIDFHRDDGSKFPAFGEEAERLAAGLQEYNAQNQTASYGNQFNAGDPTGYNPGAQAPAPPASRLDAGGGASGSWDDSPARMDGAPMTPLAGPAKEPEQEQEQEAQAPQDPMPMYSGPGGSTFVVRPGGDPDNPKDYLISEPARAGSKGGWQNSAKTVKEGKELSDDRTQAIEGSYDAEGNAIRGAVETAQERSAGELEVLDLQNAALKQREADAIQERADRDAKVQEYLKKHEQYAQEYASTEVDPKRADRGFQDDLARGLGAMGAALAGTPNFAMETIDRRISRDIRQQEQEIAKKGARADNMLSRMEKELGSRELAVKSLESVRLQQVENGMRMVAAKARPGEAKAAAEVNVARIAQVKNEKLAGYELAAQGEVTSSQRYSGGSAGSPGGLRLPTLGESGQIQKLGGAGGVGSEKTKAVMSSVNTTLKILDKYGDDEIPDEIEHASAPERVWRNTKEWWKGEGSDVRSMPEHQQMLIQDARTADEWIMSATSVLDEQGAMTDPEALRKKLVLSPAASMGEKKRYIKSLQQRFFQ